MYESPIQIVDKIQTQMIQQEEDQLLLQVQKSLGFDIDKNELLRTLNYDRDQYKKGYEDGLNQYNQIASIDCISREDAIRIASGECHFSNIPEELKKLPPVFPKCEDAISRQDAIKEATKEGSYDYISAYELSKLPPVRPKDDRQDLIDSISKLQTYKLYESGEKMVRLDKVIAILEGEECE